MATYGTFKKLVRKNKRWNTRFEKHFPKSPDLVTTVLRGHLLVEEILEELVRNYAFRKEGIAEANLSFFQKAKLAKAFVMDPLPSEVWTNILALNNLRNAFAHSLEPKKLREKIVLFTKYRREMGSRRVPVGRGAVAQVRGAIAFLLGQLSILDLVIKYMESCREYRPPRATRRSARLANNSIEKTR